MTDDWIEDFLKQRPHLREHVDLLVVPPTLDEVVQEWPEAANEPELAAGEIRFARNAHDNQGHGLTVLALYVISRRSGTNHEFAMMLANQKAPGIETNDTFWAGRKRFDQVFGEMYANDVRRRLSQRGVRLRENDEYMPELARFLGDPEAVVPFGGGRDYIRKLCEKRGWACEGAVRVKEREPVSDPHAPENCVPIAPKLVDELIREKCRENPELRRKPKAELREMVIAQHGPSPR